MADALDTRKGANQMFEDTIIAFVGSGLMAEAMIKGILREKLISPARIIGSDPLAERRRVLAERYGVEVTADNKLAVEDAGIVVLSIKPQVLPAVLKELRGLIPSQAFVLSIIPGARLGSIARGLGHDKVVRVMPNTPAQIGEGMSVWTATPQVSQLERGQAQVILAALGEEVYVEEEKYLDMATALNGSGPAYVFLFMEALVDAGVHLGFSRQVAKRIVLQTVRGAVDFARQSPLHLAQLRNMVTTPAGTTAEALQQLEEGAFRALVSSAVWAAYQRSLELGEWSEK